jgi:polysaccharide biosynthesis protein PslJ
VPDPLVSHARLDWRWPLTAILVVILFVPMRRYALPVELPFELEPYRIIVALAIALWILSLLAQPDVALRRSGLEGPVLVYAVALVASDFANPGRAAAYQSFVIRALTLGLSVVVVFYFVVSVVRTFSQVLAILKLLVVGSSVLAALALIESRTGWSPFQHLDHYFPVLQPTASFTGETRGAIRALGSAEHPIALGALFVIVAPLALYLAIRLGRWWWASVLILMAGTFATVSRTAILMLVVATLVLLMLRFRETWRFAPLLIPMVVIVHFAVPGALGATKLAFAPPGGLVAEQSNDENVEGSGRVADIGPSLELFRAKPFLGYGYGTLQSSGPRANARILDNQWLSSLLNVGLVGVLSLAWLFTRFVREVGRRARHERTVDGWLLVALVASVAAFGAGMFTYDAFTFTQVTLVFFVILALGSVLVLAPDPVFAPSSHPAPGGYMPPVRVGDGRRPALSAD